VLTQPAPTPVSTPEHHHTSRGYRAPATLVEQILAGIYAQVLGVDRVGINDSVFDLGGDSLSAMQAITAINTTLSIHLAVPTLITTPSIQSLSQQIDRRPSTAKQTPTPNPPNNP
jgi:acyl carrier protein